MNSAALTAELRAAAPGFALRLGNIVAAVAALIARAFLKDPLRVALIVPLWSYLNRTSRRFARLMDRLAAATPSRPARSGTASGTRPVRLPTAHAWLVVALRHEAAGYGSQLTHLLAQPEITALLAASPQAARLLRPLCRMLGVDPALLPPSPRRAPAPSAATARTAPPPAPAGEPLPEILPDYPRTLPDCPRARDRWPWSARLSTQPS